jgi:hypothetical protein
MRPARRNPSKLRGDPDDLWRFPVLQRLGDDLARVEQRELTRERRRNARLVAALAGTAAVVIATLLALEARSSSRTSIINRAPVAVIRSATVRYHSVIEITRDGRGAGLFLQSGEINFAKREYRERLAPISGRSSAEWRMLGDTLYIDETAIGPRGIPASAWVTTHVPSSEQAALSPASGTDSITDPLAVLRILTNLHGRVTRVGKARVEGISTTAYTTTTNLSALLHASSGTVAVPPAYAHVRAAVTVWLDRHGRPRQIEELLDGGAPGNPVTMRSKIDLTQYGASIVVTPPSAGARPLASGPPGPPVSTPTNVFEHLL